MKKITVDTTSDKKVSYHGQSANKPANISMNLFKRVVDECGKDYCITVQKVLDLLSKTIKHHTT